MFFDAQQPYFRLFEETFHIFKCSLFISDQTCKVKVVFIFNMKIHAKVWFGIFVFWRHTKYYSFSLCTVHFCFHTYRETKTSEFKPQFTKISNAGPFVIFVNRYPDKKIQPAARLLIYKKAHAHCTANSAERRKI